MDSTHYQTPLLFVVSFCKFKSVTLGLLRDKLSHTYTFSSILIFGNLSLKLGGISGLLMGGLLSECVNSRGLGVLLSGSCHVFNINREVVVSFNGI